jgi:hypothetical protein
MKRTQVFEAADGTTFETAGECREHETIVDLQTKLVGLSDGDISRAFTRGDPGLAHALELAGAIIAKKRRATGDLKRKRNAPAAFEKVETAMRKTAK